MRLTLGLAEEVPDRDLGRGALADRRCHLLRAAVARVPGGEDARPARLEGPSRPVGARAPRSAPNHWGGVLEVVAGQDEAVAVEDHAVAGDRGVGLLPDEDEGRGGGERLDPAFPPPTTTMRRVPR